MILSLRIATLLALQLAAANALAVQPYESLAGLSDDEVAEFSRSVKVVGAQPIPPPIKNTRSKLVNDREHPWKPLRAGDQRGPCPGLNTLASHGYLPRSGVATPGQIITAVQEGFNMGHEIATLVTFAAFLVDGNQLTNLMSIGDASRLTGPAPPKPALAGGLSVHGTFEGECLHVDQFDGAQLLAGDAILGDNHSFNETLFEQIVETSNKFGGGKYNVSAAAEVRWNRIQDSIARNPTFDFGNPRFATAYAESVFPLAFFIDGRVKGDDVRKAEGLDLDVMRDFFQNSRMPKGFFRRDGPFDLNSAGSGIDEIQDAHPIEPGVNNGTVSNYVPVDFFGADQGDTLCALYRKFVNTTISLYPRPRGELRKALNTNLDHFYSIVGNPNCTQSQPYP
ncbi:heme-thiolate peroxidase [Auricularia subglabra TFB-10046 SS5]|nr:heme-thiolate peroxidase [Auricularia subglabra TFB-10046 SS5]